MWRVRWSAWDGGLKLVFLPRMVADAEEEFVSSLAGRGGRGCCVLVMGRLSAGECSHYRSSSGMPCPGRHKYCESGGPREYESVLSSFYREYSWVLMKAPKREPEGPRHSNSWERMLTVPRSLLGLCAVN